MLGLDGRVIDGERDAHARRRVGENTRPGFRLPAARSHLGARRRSARTHRGKSLRGTTLASNVSFGARDYDASVGRWVSKDPLPILGLLLGNAYEYAFSDPVNTRDQTGAGPASECMAKASAACKQGCATACSPATCVALCENVMKVECEAEEEKKKKAKQTNCAILAAELYWICMNKGGSHYGCLGHSLKFFYNCISK